MLVFGVSQNRNKPSSEVIAPWLLPIFFQTSLANIPPNVRLSLLLV